MATVNAFIRTNSKAQKAHIRFRLRDGRGIQLFYKSNLEIIPSHWDKKRQEVKAKVLIDTSKRAKFNQDIANLKKDILDVYDKYPHKEQLNSKILYTEIDKFLHPEKYGLIEKNEDIFETFISFLEMKKFSISRKKAFMVIYRALKRFELYKRLTDSREYLITLENITASTLRDFEDFLVNEHILFEKFPDIYDAVPETRTPKPRGQNTINGIFTKLRTFYIWSIKNDKTKNNPFKTFKIEESRYGTPYYITIEERNKIYQHNFPHNNQLETQKDIFVFQCMIGCRIGDLYKLTRNNIVNDGIEYVARKTKNGYPVTVRVPLNNTAKAIIKKYENYNNNTLLPFISEQRYNDYIKEIFERAGITRIVTVLNPTTREAEQRPINEIASSHLARRCFVGNLYKKVKDPNLVGALSGHKEGSKAFARYREIDEETKKDLVTMLE